MVFKIIVCLVIICQLNIVWCKPWAQYGFNQSLDSTGNVNWQNPNYRDANSYGLDSLTTSKTLYPTLQPKYQPNNPWNNNNYSPQLPYGNDGQRSAANPSAFPLQPNLDKINPNNNHQATIPPFTYNGPYNINNNNNNNYNWTRPVTLPFTVSPIAPYNRSFPTNRPTSNYNNNFYNNNYNNNENRYNGGVYPNSQFNSSRDYNPQYPYQAGLNTNGNGTRNIYNNRPQNYDDRPGQPYNQNSNVQRPIVPYLGNNNIGQSTYNTPSNDNNNRQFPNNGQSSYNGPANFNNPHNNNVISNRNSFEPLAPSINSAKNNGPPAQPDYDPNGIALAPFPGSTGNDPLFNPQNIYGRQRPNKYINNGIHDTGTLHVPLAPFPTGR